MVKTQPISRPEGQVSLAKQRKPRRFFPPLALRLFVISILLVLSAVFFVDRLVLPGLEDRGLLASHGWEVDNRIRWRLLDGRNSATYESPVWRSKLWPVNHDKNGEKRILVIGDSFVWGDGYANLNDIWWRQLERELRSRGYNQVSVMAAGMCGAQTAEQSRWLEQVAAAYNPDLVIMGFVNNDTQEYEDPAKRSGIIKRLKQFQSPMETIEKTSASVLPYLSLHLRELRQSSYSKKNSSTANGFETSQWNYELLRGENFQSYKNTVSSLSRTISSLNCPVFVLTLPSGYHLATPREPGENELDHTLRDVYAFHRHIYDKVGPVFEEAGIRFVDNLDGFISGAREDKYISGSVSPRFAFGINPRNSHPGPYSTHFYARSACDVLERDFQSCLGEKVAETGRSKSVIVINDTAPGDLQLSEGKQARTFELAYPQSDDSLLFMPERTPFIQLNLEKPTLLRSIGVRGSSLSRARVWVSCIDPQVGYDPGVFRELERKCDSSGFEFEVPADVSSQINSIRVNADFKGGNRTLELELGGS